MMTAVLSKFWKQFRYSFHILTHPFDGFYDIKHEKKGSAAISTLFVFLLIVTFILKRQFTGFVLNTSRPSDLNIFAEAAGVLLPFGLWCISNWCLTTLTEGEGSFRDIYIYSGYALFPMILINLPMIVYSNFVVQEEAGFYSFFIGLAMVWSGLLFMVGTLVTHQFTLSKTIFSLVVIIVGMGVIAFIGLLFFNLIQQMYDFVSNLYYEYSFRI